MIPEIPKFRFIRELCKGRSDEELREADAAFMAYVEYVVSQAERIRNDRREADCTASVDRFDQTPVE